MWSDDQWLKEHAGETLNKNKGVEGEEETGKRTAEDTDTVSRTWRDWLSRALETA